MVACLTPPFCFLHDPPCHLVAEGLENSSGTHRCFQWEMGKPSSSSPLCPLLSISRPWLLSPFLPIGKVISSVELNSLLAILVGACLGRTCSLICVVPFFRLWPLQLGLVARMVMPRELGRRPEKSPHSLSSDRPCPEPRSELMEFGSGQTQQTLQIQT